MLHRLKHITLLIGLLCTSTLYAQDSIARIEAIVSDIYEQIIETSEIDHEELQSDLLYYASNPINLNSAKAADLAALHFLSDNQIDAILLYVHQHPMQSVGELDLIRELQPYEARNLKVFVTVAPVQEQEKLYGREVFRYAKHEVLTRVDARNLEDYTGDPIYGQIKYQFNYQKRVQFGINLRRQPGSSLRDLGYGLYVQLNDFGIVKTIVAGNYQAQFGTGMVVSNPYHQGKNNYLTSISSTPEGLRKYSSANGQGLHGVGTTLQFEPIPQKMRILTSLFYSIQKNNDSLRHHTIGANIDLRYQKLKIGLTAIENIYSDSVRYYNETDYNQNYFHGQYQAVIGLNFRFQHKWLDLFGEVATSQNKTWGVGVEVGGRLTPIQDVGFILLYRYYSPTFDNILGYAFAQSSRINDENGLYLGTEIKRLPHWRFSLYGDIYRFSGPKYGIKYAPSMGYEAYGEAQWLRKDWSMLWRFRAREKAHKSTYDLRYRFDWQQGGWKIRTQVDGNIVQDSINRLSWGMDVYQDIQYSFTIPLTLQFRLQGFYAPNWDNRIYIYENDVLYGNSSVATYGQGGHFYLNLRWQIIRQLALYFKVSETIYEKNWALTHNKEMTRTDIHLLLRATF